MTGDMLTIAEIAALSGADAASISEHLEDAALIGVNGSPTRLAHLLDVVSIDGEDVPRWNLPSLKQAVHDGMDRLPPVHSGATQSVRGTLELGRDEATLLASGWSFDIRRDEFEAIAIRRIAEACGVDQAAAATLRADELTVTGADGRANRFEACIVDGTLLVDGPIAIGFHATSSHESEDEQPDDVGASSPPDDPIKAIVRDETEIGGKTPSSASAGDEAVPDHDPEDRESAWSSAMRESKNRGITATSLAYQCDLRMNSNTREALLRGGLPSDHILSRVCSAMGITLQVDLNPKGVPAKAEHYPRLADAIRRRATMTVVSRSPSSPIQDAGPVGGTDVSAAPPEAESEKTPARTGEAYEPDACALVRILSAARTTDAACQQLRERTLRAMTEARSHRSRAESLEQRLREFEQPLARIGDVLMPNPRH